MFFMNKSKSTVVAVVFASQCRQGIQLHFSFLLNYFIAKMIKLFLNKCEDIAVRMMSVSDG